MSSSWRASQDAARRLADDASAGDASDGAGTVSQVELIYGDRETHVMMADGTYEGNHGWASVLSTGLAGKSLNRAAQAGVDVDRTTLAQLNVAVTA